ncbi:MAG: ABC transporter permease subunit [Rickettsiales bacterium]|nr:ABC transporter permease subunit [Rickettsiales bacterium]MCA0254539.1 ABC transporter permease subunit [Pseudomonadota bacterium]
MSNSDVFKPFAILLIVFWLTVFVFIPNLGVVIISFLERDERTFINFVFTLKNYEKLFSVIYLKVFFKTFIIAMCITLVCLLLGYFFVYAIFQTTKNKKIKDFLLILVIIPFWTSSLIRTYSIMVLLRANGVVNNFLMSIGVIEAPLELLYNEFAIAVGLVYSLLPFMILPIYTSFDKLDYNYIYAAQDLGARKLSTLIRIIIPLTKFGIITGCILVFLSTLGMFFIPELLGGSKEILLGNLIKNQFLIARDWPFGAAIATMLTAILVKIMFFQNRNTDQVVI